MLSQSDIGASVYKEISAITQDKLYERLLCDVKIQEGWNVLDVGCGTGNNTTKLLQTIGSNGSVIGLDPITMRIKHANQAHVFDNMTFHVAYGRDASSYGKNFDLVISGTVMHWIPYEEKAKTFESVYNSLKPGGTFTFNAVQSDTHNLLSGLLPLVSDKKMVKHVNESIFSQTDEEYRDLANKTGFKYVLLDAVPYVVVHKSVESLLHHLASSAHVADYSTFMELLQDVIAKKEHDLNFLYNEHGEPCIKATYQFVRCQK